MIDPRSDDEIQESLDNKQELLREAWERKLKRDMDAWITGGHGQ